jgi:MinD superfamily P-loop ATPase
MPTVNSSAQQWIVLSGKGGTGKTSITAALAHLARESEPAVRAVLVDADVDAANLGLVLQPDFAERREFWGGSLARIDEQRCRACGKCADVCRYDAVLKGDPYRIDPTACDGCAACVYACPHNAVGMIQQKEGEWFRSNTRYGPLFHAELLPGRENSGKLVMAIKRQALAHAREHLFPLILIDGPPGIGCPVISASTGVDLALIVTEPSVSGLHDLMRTVAMLQHFRVRAFICINKSDLYPAGAAAIHHYADSARIEIVGEVPFDPVVVDAMIEGQPVTVYRREAAASLAMQSIWKRLTQTMLTRDRY